MRIAAQVKLTLLLVLATVIGAALAMLSARWARDSTHTLLIALGVGAVISIGICAWLARIITAPVRSLLRALAGAVASFRDGDFSVSLVADRGDELGQLIEMHNELGNTLREQRHQLVQRERLLDTITQHSPVALLLVDAHNRVAYSNIAARHLLNEGTSLQGLDFEAVLQRSPAALREAVEVQEDALFSVPGEDIEETYHLAQRRFQLGGRPHRLLLIKHLTRELSRQEVAIWKKLIRTLAHELNNSLAPISSLTRSGAELARRGATDLLPPVFATIGERAARLHEFIAGYSAFARLPAPRPERVPWKSLCDILQGQASFVLAAPVPETDGYFDRIQLEQALINLLKNAHESGSAPGNIELAVTCAERLQRIEVRDRGSGMSDVVLTQALLPFYSTKRSGSGLGLALAREIAEAHGGQIRLANRQDGGLTVTLLLPLPA